MNTPHFVKHSEHQECGTLASTRLPAPPSESEPEPEPVPEGPPDPGPPGPLPSPLGPDPPFARDSSFDGNSSDGSDLDNGFARYRSQRVRSRSTSLENHQNREIQALDNKQDNEQVVETRLAARRLRKHRRSFSVFEASPLCQVRRQSEVSPVSSPQKQTSDSETSPAREDFTFDPLILAETDSDLWTSSESGLDSPSDFPSGIESRTDNAAESQPVLGYSGIHSSPPSGTDSGSSTYGDMRGRGGDLRGSDDSTFDDLYDEGHQSLPALLFPQYPLEPGTTQEQISPVDTTTLSSSDSTETRHRGESEVEGLSDLLQYEAYDAYYASSGIRLSPLDSDDIEEKISPEDKMKVPTSGSVCSALVSSGNPGFPTHRPALECQEHYNVWDLRPSATPQPPPADLNELIDFSYRRLLINDTRNRSDDRGEVTRMGGGESYRPSTGRAPLRSPPRADTFRSGRDRRTSPISETYLSGSRRRSRSPGPRDSANWRERPRSPRPRSENYSPSVSC